jgi:hypothetical protein
MIVILVRNKAHLLPHFLYLLENLDYPKNRISLLIRSDHNEDATNEILSSWSKRWREKVATAKGYPDEDVYHTLDVSISQESDIRHFDQVPIIFVSMSQGKKIVQFFDAKIL